MKIDVKAIGFRTIGILKERESYGRDRATPRAIILDQINKERRAFVEPKDFEKIEDVVFLSVYRDLPICSCENGLYIPSSAEDLEAFRIYMRAKALPLFERVKRVAQEYPEYAPKDGQLTLGI